MIERRFLTTGEHAAAGRRVDVEFRVDEDDGKAKIRGYASVFNEPTVIYGMREIVRPGAFSKTIREGDARGLWNHDPNFVLGRVGSGTLSIEEDEIGLAYTVNAPATDLIRDLVVEPIRRGDVNGSSFGFEVVKDRMTRPNEDGLATRELVEVKLYDVGPVTFPAYEATDADFRSMLREARSLREVEILAAFRNSGLTDGSIRAICHRMVEILEADGSQGEPDLAAIHAAHRRRLELAGLEL